jgi:hypothetical protein
MFEIDRMKDNLIESARAMTRRKPKKKKKQQKPAD